MKVVPADFSLVERLVLWLLSSLERLTLNLAEQARLEALISAADTRELLYAARSMATVLAERAFHALRLLEGLPLPAGRCIHRQQTFFSVPIHSERGLRLHHCLEESKLPPGARLGWQRSLQGKPLLRSGYGMTSSRV